VVPAAGVGRRMGTEVPKQYLKILGKPVLQHTLEHLLQVERVSGIVVVLGKDDEYWDELPCSTNQKILRADGGKERSDSVLSGLLRLSALADPADWVLVHDAARMCITQKDVNHLINVLKDDPVGGILGLPVTDTLKSADSGNIIQTIDRTKIWRALTPQMFRYELLTNALEAAKKLNHAVTDEASAMEYQGYVPKIIEGRSDNIKITRPEDLSLAAFFLENQCSE
jgi:2-C-methyl-D-erythritol 4-phosphate cytidylyltransferase